MLSLTRSWFALFLLVLPTLVSAAPLRNELPKQRRHITLPIQQRRVSRENLRRDDGLVGTVGVGDLADLYVPHTSPNASGLRIIRKQILYGFSAAR